MAMGWPGAMRLEARKRNARRIGLPIESNGVALVAIARWKRDGEFTGRDGGPGYVDVGMVQAQIHFDRFASLRFELESNGALPGFLGDDFALACGGPGGGQFMRQLQLNSR